MPHDDGPCPQAWHGGLHSGVLRECKYAARHRGWHRTQDGSMAWGGKLTDEEHALAEALRLSQASTV